MPRCSCAGSTCGCKVQGGDGIQVTGLGTQASPYIISATIGDLASAMEFDDTADVVFSVVGDGTPSDPLVISATTPRKNFPVYPTGGLPDPSVWGEGAFAYDSTRDAPVFSDGAAWRLAAPKLRGKAVFWNTLPAACWVNPGDPGVLDSTLTLTAILGTLYLTPIDVAIDSTIATVGVSLATGGTTGNVHFGLWASNAAGRPTGSPVWTNSASSTTSGNKTASPARAIAAGERLWLGILVLGADAGTMRRLVVTNAGVGAWSYEHHGTDSNAAMGASTNAMRFPESVSVASVAAINTDLTAATFAAIASRPLAAIQLTHV